MCASCYNDDLHAERVPDIPLIRKVMEHIENEPAQWFQGHWFDAAPDAALAALGVNDVIETADAASCGTTACFAGHTLLLAGEATLRLSKIRGVYDSDYVTAVVSFVDKAGKVISEERVPRLAADLLGLNEEQVRAIFYATEIREPAKMRELVEEMIGERL